MGLEKPEMNVGKRMDSGIGNASTKGTFQNEAGVSSSVYMLSVSGLNFKPRVIVVYRADGYPSVTLDTNAPKVSGYAVSNNPGSFRYRVGVGDFKILDGSFSIPTIVDNMAYNNNLYWVAYE